MSKAQDSKKQTRKTPSKTPKERKGGEAGKESAVIGADDREAIFATTG